MPARTHGGHPAARRGCTRLAAVFLALALSACGDGTSPAPTQPPQPITADQGPLRPFETATLNLGANAISEPEVSGTLGEIAVSGARLTDSTLALLIPEVATGTQVLTLTTGGKTYQATLQIQAALAIANPQATLDTVASQMDSLIDAQVETLAGEIGAGTLSGSDAAEFQAQLTAVQDKAADFRASVASLTADERAQVAAFFDAHPDLFGDEAGAASLMASRLAFDQAACTDGKACYDAIDKALLLIRNGCATYVAVKLSADAASWLVGLAGKVTIEGLEIVTAGVLLGYVVNELRIMIHTPVKPSLEPASGNLVALSSGTANSETTPVFRSGTAGALTVDAEYRSLTAADLVGDAAAGAIAASLRAVQDIFATVSAGIPFIDITVPSFPAAPLSTVTAAIPPAQLALGDMSATGFGATAATSGTSWMLTFTNPTQGADHDVVVPIRFTPPGLEVQTGTRTVTVQPQVYGVKTLEIVAPDQTSVGVNATLALTTVSKDSADRTLSADELGTRTPEWTSSSTSVATVDDGGTVTGEAEGSVTIEATLERGTADLALTVVASDSTAIYRDAIVGEWTLVWNQADGSYYETDHILLRADGTGYVSSEDYVDGHTDTFAPDVVSTSWTIQKNHDGRYEMRYWQNLFPSVVHYGLLTYPITPMFESGVFNTVLSKN